MGGKPSTVLSRQDVELYAELTFLKKSEIIRAFTLFRSFDQFAVDVSMTCRISTDVIIEHIPEIKNNPFAERLLNLFSSEEDGCLSFEDFLDMLSVFSRAAPDTLKARYAFRLYDFDGDSYLGRADLGRVVERLTRNQSSGRLSREEKTVVVDNILEESDIDQDGSISLQEFLHVVARCPDFVHAFSFELV